MKSSPAILLTGATGLLGRFILRRLLQAGHDVGVIVRPSNVGASATGGASGFTENTKLVRQRIEQALQPFEIDGLLSRPRPIAWDFAEVDQSGQASEIASEDLAWLKSRQLVVIHCAASIRFQQDPVSGEPYRTNVSGTGNLLNLCSELNVAAFHHVSTAYVGQHRSSDTVLEVPVQSPDQAGNDYERSKIQAELLVMRSPYAGASRAIHRPSIVVGDSVSGFTSTFHGFYAPLQIGWQYAKMFGFSEQAGQWFRQQLGLEPSDRKNLVNVDWVAEGIVTAAEQTLESTESSPPATTILHWTNPEPVACQAMQNAIVDAIERGMVDRDMDRGARPTQWRSSQTASSQNYGEGQNPPSPEQFREQMQVYESYFQSDPVFDQRQSSRVSQNLHCPRVDFASLSRLSDWAIQAGFGWPKPSLPQLPNQCIVDAVRQFDWLKKPVDSRIVQVQLLGPGSPETLCFSLVENDFFQVAGGHPVDETWRVGLQVLADCVSGTIDLTQTIDNGYWLIEGKSNRGGLDYARIWINHIGKFLR